ncbi:hypothetical protein PR048_013636 [Dryococelus australis]|uniref:Uncharacterized protein n=1 Tax=Dryococelus australis TaxID=614101 RepID=A0ABQ9HTK0_9NEOP|nr:hypothetical protein PR048_013636 [Dryococelus australis]
MKGRGSRQFDVSYVEWECVRSVQNDGQSSDIAIRWPPRDVTSQFKMADFSTAPLTAGFEAALQILYLILTAHWLSTVTDEGDDWTRTSVLQEIAILLRSRTGFDSRRGRPGILAWGNRAGRYRWSAGFLGVVPYLPPLQSNAAPYSPRFTHNGSQDLDPTREIWEQTIFGFQDVWQYPIWLGSIDGVAARAWPPTIFIKQKYLTHSVEEYIRKPRRDAPPPPPPSDPDATDVKYESV